MTVVANARFNPLPIRIDQADKRQGGVKQGAGYPCQPIETFFRGRVEHRQRVQIRKTGGFVVG